MKDVLLFSNAFTCLVKQYLSHMGVSYNIPENDWKVFIAFCKTESLKFISGGFDEERFAFRLLLELEGLFRKNGVVIPDEAKHSSEDVYNLDNDVYVWLENSVLELAIRYLSGNRLLINRTHNPKVNHDSLTFEVIEIFKSFLSSRNCLITVSKKDWDKLAVTCKPRKIEWLPYKNDNYSLSYYYVWVMDIYVGHFVSMMSTKGYKFDKGVYDDLVPAIRAIIPCHVDWTPFFSKVN